MKKANISFAASTACHTKWWNCATLLIGCSLFMSCYTGGTALQPGQQVPMEWQKQSQFAYPTAYSAPMMHQNETVAFSLDYKNWDKGKGYGGSADVRVSPKWVLHGSFGNFNFSEQFETTTTQWELGAGYTGIINPKWNWEVFAGTGRQSFKHTYFSGSSSFYDQYFYVQPAVYLYTPKPFFTIGMATRFTLQNYTLKDKIIPSTYKQDFTEAQLELVKSGPAVFSMEPGLVVRAGKNSVHLTLQYFFMAHLTQTDLHGQNNIFSASVRVPLLELAAPLKKNDHKQ